MKWPQPCHNMKGESRVILEEERKSKKFLEISDGVYSFYAVWNFILVWFLVTFQKACSPAAKTMIIGWGVKYWAPSMEFLQFVKPICSIWFYLALQWNFWPWIFFGALHNLYVLPSSSIWAGRDRARISLDINGRQMLILRCGLDSRRIKRGNLRCACTSMFQVMFLDL